MTLYTNSKTSGLASLYNRRLKHLNISLSKTETIEIKTIDELCAEHNIRESAYLKLMSKEMKLNCWEEQTI